MTAYCSDPMRHGTPPPQVFFCKYNDPGYVKMEKLDIMTRLVSERNIDQVRVRVQQLPAGAGGRLAAVEGVELVAGWAQVRRVG